MTDILRDFPQNVFIPKKTALDRVALDAALLAGNIIFYHTIKHIMGGYLDFTDTEEHEVFTT